MKGTIDRDQLLSRLRRAARLVREERDELSRLDSFGGDGDHGTTMARAMDQMEQAIEAAGEAELPALLQGVGWAILGVDGGATGPLLGSFFLGMAERLGVDEIDADALANAGEAGLLGVQRNTRAGPGDKTLMDALAPAVQALREAAEQGCDAPEGLRRAAAAAEQGAAATRDLKARFGRAKHVGEKSVGHPDPGATSIALIFRGLSEGE